MNAPGVTTTTCIETCLRCYEVCFGQAMSHCLVAGGPHLEPSHFRLMMACAEMCRACAHILLTGSSVHTWSCRACADICAACAIDCERIPDMRECAAICRRCAEECRRLAG